MGFNDVTLLIRLKPLLSASCWSLRLFALRSQKKVTSQVAEGETSPTSVFLPTPPPFFLFLLLPPLLLLPRSLRQEKLTIGGDHDNSLTELAVNGNPTGFNVDLIRAVAE